MSGPPLRVLITVRELDVRAGTQLYTRDLAEELRRCGHLPVVYTSRPGAVAAEIRRAGVPVVERLADFGETPDVIHGQHHLEAMAAMLRFPAVPSIFVCHGWLPWVEAPPRFPTLVRYVAVDTLRRERLVVEHGIPSDQVTVLHNFVDLERFRPRPPLPPRPRRALLLSNHASRGAVTPAVAEACRAAGVDLEVAGASAGRSLERPEEVLPAFDLVLARGRAALEAMAVGAAVVLCDVEGDGPMVTPGDYVALRDLNFGVGTLRSPLDAGRLRAQIERYDAVASAQVSARVRREAGRTAAVERLVALYREAIAAARGGVGADHAASCLRAAARYTQWLSGTVLSMEEDRASHWWRVRDAERRAEAAEARAAAAEASHGQVRSYLTTLERSPFSRLRRRLLRVPGVATSYRRLRGL
jgi:glycosyltransferase involved in cell wall biosynthesis